MNAPDRRARALLFAALLCLAPASASAGEGDAPPPPAADGEQALLEALLQQARPIAEKARGLAFKKDVPVSPVTREAFVDRYVKEVDRIMGGEAKVAAMGRLLDRLGILDAETDLASIIGKFVEGNVAANYDPQTGRVVFLPGTGRSLDVMVHELVHALDDQHFDMKARIESWHGHLDRMLAFGALCEGDAQSIQTRHVTGGAMAQWPMETLRTMAENMATAVLQGKYGTHPPAIVMAFKSQYLEGAIFAETLRRTEKGEEAINAAFRAPPASTEQVLHPEKFLSGEAPVAVALPAPPEGAGVAAATTLGELAMRIVLRTRGLGAPEAAAAAGGWNGDTVALVTWAGGREALVWVSSWDTEKDAEEFFAAMETAFPDAKDQDAQRGLVRRGTRVEFVSAPLDVLPDAISMARKAEIR